MKKQAWMITTVALALVLSQSYPIQAESFEGREDEMNKKCSAIYDEKTQDECSAYKDYLLNKKNDADSTVNQLKDQIASIQGDINKAKEVIEKNNQQLIEAQGVLDSVEAAVIETNASIEKLKVQIKEKEESIKERDKQMRERLIEMQPYIGSNNFVDFLMGASSFTDLLRRTSIVGELNSYEREQIEALNKEKQELKVKQEDVSLKKELLEAQEKDAKRKTEEVKAIKEASEQIVAAYREQEAAMQEEKIKAQVASGQYASSIPTIDLNIIPKDWGDESSGSGSDGSSNNNQNGNGNQNGNQNENENQGGNDNQNNNQGGSNNNGGSSNPPLSTGFVRPIQGNAYYSAGTWYYPGGTSMHLGMDMGTYQSVGLPVVAPATGIIAAIHDGVANHPINSNGFGDMSGYPSGGGNTLHMIVNVNGISYGITFAHLSPGMFNVNIGDIVQQGQVIAHTGYSGNATGPHCHIELTNLGKISINEAYQLFVRMGKDYFYGNYNLDGTCNNKGSTPCLLRPEDYMPH